MDASLKKAYSATVTSTVIKWAETSFDFNDCAGKSKQGNQ